MNLDVQILEHLSNQNEKGIQLIITYYGALLKSVVGKHLYSLQGYQGECLNDTLLAIWNNWDKFDPNQSSLKNWMCAIARYRAINYLKKHARELDEVEFEQVAPYLINQQAGPLEKERWQIELNHLLKALNPLDRRLFIDLFIEDQTVEDVARKHNLSKANLYQRISRGRKKLRKEKLND